MRANQTSLSVALSALGALFALAWPTCAVARQIEVHLLAGVPVHTGPALAGTATDGGSGPYPVVLAERNASLPLTLGLRFSRAPSRAGAAVALEGAYDVRSVLVRIASPDPGQPQDIFLENGQVMSGAVRVVGTVPAGGRVRWFLAAGPAVVWHGGKGYERFRGRWAAGGSLGTGMLFQMGRLSLRAEVSDLIAAPRFEHPDVAFRRRVRHTVAAAVGVRVGRLP